jgi:small subunit ribosomal protein S15
MADSSTQDKPTEVISEIAEALQGAELAAMGKDQVISKFQRSTSDTGSPEVQIALLTQRLVVLAKHFAAKPKDLHSRRGMMNLISQRKQLLQYLRNEDVNRYRTTIAALGLRK